MSRSKAPALALVCAAGLVFTMSGCVTPEGGGGQFNMLSTQEEIQLGNKLSAEVEANEKILNDAQIQQYVRAIGDRLAKQSPRQDVPYMFTVVDSPDTVNAFALPGGHMYIYTGLLKLCDNEAQLASVMGHEIGHVAAEHHGEQYTRQYGYSILASAILGENPAQSRQVISQIAGNLVAMGFSREQEREADRIGMDLMWRAGYKPDEMVTFMQRMMQSEGGQTQPRLLQFFASHPATAERIQNLSALVQQYPADIRANSPTYADRYQSTILNRLR